MSAGGLRGPQYHGPQCRFLLARRSGRAAELKRVLRPADLRRFEVGPLILRLA
jgi:hypothetical protein